MALIDPKELVHPFEVNKVILRTPEEALELAEGGLSDFLAQLPVDTQRDTIDRFQERLEEIRKKLPESTATDIESFPSVER